jgi:hypothetical protein
MDKKDFIKLINLLVDKKIKEILPDMVKREVKKYMESGIEPNEDDFSSDVKNLLPYSVSKSPVIRDGRQTKASQTEQKKWSKNPIINNILNETAQNYTQLASDSTDMNTYRQLIESEYENIDNEFTFNTNNMMSAVKPSSEVLKSKVIQDGATPAIANIMITDYSKMLKTMDKAAKDIRRNKTL